MSKFLLSVRNKYEAKIALANNVDIIDVKNPSKGSLGKADDKIIQEILDIASNKPVTAAMGELIQNEPINPELLSRLHYVKYGLSNLKFTWKNQIEKIRTFIESKHRCKVVLVAYADAEHAYAPNPDNIIDHAVREKYSAILLDTWQKCGKTLLDWISLNRITDYINTCHANQIQVALAGSISRKEINLLSKNNPDWFALRSAACANQSRNSKIKEQLVIELADLIHTEATINVWNY